MTRLPSVSRGSCQAVAYVVAGAAFGALCLTCVYAWSPAVVLEMDRDLPSVAIGLHDVERHGDLTYAWTTERADFTFRGLDRSTAWSCAVRLSGARPDAASASPDVRIAVDGMSATHAPADAEFRDVRVDVPARPAVPGLRLTLAVSPTFVPDEADPRRLGVRIDRVSCVPADRLARPPGRALTAAALASGALSLGFALMGLAALPAVALVVLVAAAQAWVLTRGIGPYSAFLDEPAWLAVWIAFGAVLAAKLWAWLSRSSCTAVTGVAIAVSAGIMYFKLLALAHPSKDLVDAVFHAHRLDWVMAGRFYFTQLSTSATPFPYAIGLYVFSAPFAALVRDHVLLLRASVCAWEALAGLLLYVLVSRTRQDRLAGMFALILFAAVPLPFTILGNANLTSAFGAASSVVAVVLCALWTGHGPRVLTMSGLTVVTTLAFISHISALTLLGVTLVLVGLLYLLLGGAALRGSARRVFGVTLGALVLSVTLYWGHFGPVYVEQLTRARTAATADAPATPPPAAARGSETLSGLGSRRLPVGERIAAAAAQTEANLGWPLLTLFGVGLWRLAVTGVRDRLGLALSAWGLTAAAFLAVAVLGPGNTAYQQDAWEFIGRVEHATLPAAIVPASLAAAWLWRRSGPTRLVSCMLLLAAVATGVVAWAAWLLPS